MNKEFDRIINQKVEQLKEAPSSGLWNKIEAKVPVEKKSIWLFMVSFLRKPLVKYPIAAIVIFLMGGYTSYYFVKKIEHLKTENRLLNEKSIVNFKKLDDETKDIEQKLNQSALKPKIEHIDTFAITQEEIPISKENQQRPKENQGITKEHQKKIKERPTKKKKVISTQKTTKENHPVVPKENSSSKGTRARDYVWIYNAETKSYTVKLKSEE